MKDAAELKNHVYDIVGALHSVHDELGVPKSANGHGRVSPCAKGKLFQIVVSKHQKALR